MRILGRGGGPHALPAIRNVSEAPSLVPALIVVVACLRMHVSDDMLMTNSCWQGSCAMHRCAHCWDSDALTGWSLNVLSLT